MAANNSLTIIPTDDPLAFIIIGAKLTEQEAVKILRAKETISSELKYAVIDIIYLYAHLSTRYSTVPQWRVNDCWRRASKHATCIELQEISPTTIKKVSNKTLITLPIY